MKSSILKQTVIIFCLAVLIDSVAAVIFCFAYNNRLTGDIAGQLARAGAASAAHIVENTDYGELTQSETSDVYLNTRDCLKEICGELGLKYLYVYEVSPGKDSIRYIISVASEEDSDKRVAEERGLGAVVSRALKEQELYALEGVEPEKAYVEKNEYGNVYTWTCPVIKDGAVIALVGSDYSARMMFLQEVHRTLAVILPMIAVLIFAIFMALVAIRKKILFPINVLSQRMNGFITDEGVALEPLDIHPDNEIGEMADSFDKMCEDIKSYLENIENLTAERARASAELDVARRIQNGIVPEKTEISRGSYNVSVRAKAARDVGGDFYDCLEFEDGRLCVVIGDVSGKGIAAAMFMVMTRTLLNDRLRGGYSPAAALNSVNEVLCQSNPEGMFATVFAAVLNSENGELCFANAGHTKPVITGGNARFLEVDSGISIGVFENSDIKDECIKLNKGDSIILYSDGVTDMVNVDKEFFGADRLFESVRAADSARNAIKSLGKAAFEFAAGAEQFDDYTVLALNYTGAETMLRLSPTKDSLPELRKSVLDIAGANQRGRKIYLACEEVFVNIADYSEASLVEIEFEKKNDTLKITFSDNGVPFDPVSADTGHKRFCELDSGGMGLNIIKQIAENISYRRYGGKNILTLVFVLGDE